MWEYIKLVAHQMWVLFASGVLVVVAALKTVFPHIPVLSALPVSPWFWVFVVAVGLIAAQALAARTLMRSRKDSEAPKLEITHTHHNYGTVHYHGTEQDDGD